MFVADYHIHSAFSGHSGLDMNVRNIALRAAEVGLEQILILEHVPMVNEGAHALVLEHRYTEGIRERIQIDAILDERKRFLATGPTPLQILVGAEVDADPHRMDGSLLLSDLHDIDVVSASTHYLPGGRGFWYDGTTWPAAERRAMYEEWFAWAKRIAANPDVDILAHPGAALCAVGAIETFSGPVLEDMGHLLETCRKHRTAFECNELLRRKLTPPQAQTYSAVLALAREVGVPISLGSDAHHLASVGAFSWVRELTAAAGIGPEHLFTPQPRKPQSSPPPAAARP